MDDCALNDAYHALIRGDRSGAWPMLQRAGLWTASGRDHGERPCSVSPELLYPALLSGNFCGKISDRLQHPSGGNQTARDAETHGGGLCSHDGEIGLVSGSTIGKQQLVATHALDAGAQTRIEAKAPCGEPAADIGLR